MPGDSMFQYVDVRASSSVLQHGDAMDSMLQHSDAKGLYTPAGHSREQGQAWIGRHSVRLGERSDSYKASGI